jgi:hypothetical protein
VSGTENGKGSETGTEIENETIPGRFHLLIAIVSVIRIGIGSGSGVGSGSGNGNGNGNGSESESESGIENTTDVIVIPQESAVVGMRRPARPLEILSRGSDRHPLLWSIRVSREHSFRAR